MEDNNGCRNLVIGIILIAFLVFMFFVSGIIGLIFWGVIGFVIWLCVSNRDSLNLKTPEQIKEREERRKEMLEERQRSRPDQYRRNRDERNNPPPVPDTAELETPEQIEAREERRKEIPFERNRQDEQDSWLYTKIMTWIKSLSKKQK